MTGPGAAERSARPDPPGRRDQAAEEVLEQALRALAGGRPDRSQPPQRGRSAPAPFTPLQVMLLAVLLGLLIGMTAGVLSLLS